jgi:hypothetical protein
MGRLAAVQRKVESVKDVMGQNIEMVGGRGGFGCLEVLGRPEGVLLC